MTKRDLPHRTGKYIFISFATLFWLLGCRGGQHQEIQLYGETVAVERVGVDRIQIENDGHQLIQIGVSNNQYNVHIYADDRISIIVSFDKWKRYPNQLAVIAKRDGKDVLISYNVEGRETNASVVDDAADQH